MSGTPPFSLEGFVDAFDARVKEEEPPDSHRLRVLDWIFTRAESPYEGLRREPGFANLRFGVVPGTERGSEVVVCSLWVVEAEHVVRADRFATLSSPV